MRESSNSGNEALNQFKKKLKPIGVDDFMPEGAPPSGRPAGHERVEAKQFKEFKPVSDALPPPLPYMKRKMRPGEMIKTPKSPGGRTL